jgi:hypothetical protein
MRAITLAGAWLFESFRYLLPHAPGLHAAKNDEADSLLKDLERGWL